MHLDPRSLNLIATSSFLQLDRLLHRWKKLMTPRTVRDSSQLNGPYTKLPANHNGTSPDS